MNIIIRIIAIAWTLMLLACTNQNNTSDKRPEFYYKKENVVSFFYHNIGSYSVMVREGSQLKPIAFPMKGALKVSSFDDVSVDDDMWYEREARQSSPSAGGGRIAHNAKHYLGVFWLVTYSRNFSIVTPPALAAKYDLDQSKPLLL